ncbi:histamine N-methyltransferase B-like isoform X1 [Lytechinus variegatus]|uniref:histamine N-methyltransferase B-like isoform X1 n=2 Tax=Lytechinus variegatus TaxID=7654 RepID=UPI001BB28842|nr:histamine N-methyltransferase B-like isoform X1 [Lytechinus variegatus]
MDQECLTCRMGYLGADLVTEEELVDPVISNRRDSGMTTIKEDHYLDALTEFIRRCDQEEVMLAWIKKRCPNILNVLPIVESSPSNPVRVIGVGCGNGIMDVQVLREMSSLSAFTQEIAIEPNDAELLRFKARIEEDERLKSFTFDWIHATTEVFEVTMNQLVAEGAFPKVHFVHMLQMLYHARDMESTISNYYKALLDGGVMLITIASKKNNDMFKSFLDLEPKRNKQAPKNKKRYSDDVTRVLRRLGLKYDIENVIYHLDITECFKEDSKGGKLLLDFICLTNAAQVYQTLTTSDRDRLMKRLLDHCEQHPDGRVTVRLSFDAIVVTKSSEQTLLVPSSADSSADGNKLDAQ